MTVSALSVGFSGSNSTRLLKHGIAGQTDEMVAVSWMAKPWGKSSRWVRVRSPPGLAACAGADGQDRGERESGAATRARRLDTDHRRSSPRGAGPPARAGGHGRCCSGRRGQS